MPLDPAAEQLVEDLLDLYRQAQANIDELIATASDLTVRGRAYRSRLTGMSRAITETMADLDAAARGWTARSLPEVYALGAEGAAREVGERFSWSQIHREAVQQLATETFDDLLAATRYVRRDTKAFIRIAAREHAAAVLLEGKTATQAGRELARRLQDRGIRAVTYKNGARHTLGDYSDTVVRTRSALAHAGGQLNIASEYGIEWVQVSDGAGCGWSAHGDPDLANGSVRSRAEAEAYPIAHPRCVLPETPFRPHGQVVEIVRAWFSGDVYRLHLATPTGPDQLTIGPNHPVLTRSGWKPGHLIAEGEQVVYDARPDHAGDVALELHLGQVPTIEDAFESIRRLGSHIRVPASSDDLHGDAVFCEGEIEVVRPPRDLLPVADAPVVEQAGEHDLVRSDVDLLGTLRPGVPRSLLAGVPLAAGSLVRGGVDGVALLDRPALPHQLLRLDQVPADPEVAQHLPNRRARGSEPLADLVAREVLVEVPAADVVDPGGDRVGALGGAVAGGLGPVGGGGVSGAAPLASEGRPLGPPVGARAGEAAELPGSVVAEGDPALEALLDVGRGHLSLASIVAVERVPYEGWVYDVTTTAGTFSGSRIVLKNCARSFALLPVQTKEEAKRVAAGDYGDVAVYEPTSGGGGHQKRLDQRQARLDARAAKVRR